jgi:hypothetical protein
VEREYRVTWGELLLDRYSSRITIEYSVAVSLGFRFCYIITSGLVKHRIGAFKNKNQRGLLDANKVKVRKILVMEYIKFYI